MNPYIDDSFESYYKKNPLTLVDIGAMSGTNKRWDRFNKYLQIIGFEPDERAFKQLAEGKLGKRDTVTVRYLNTALYNVQNEMKLHVTKKEGNSSLLLPNKDVLGKFPDPDRFKVLNTKQLKVDLLDNQLKKCAITDVDFIKIDTQGSELFILQGATDILRNSVFGLEIEVEFIELYEKQPLFADIDSFMRQLGFQLFDLRKAYWKRAIGKNVKGGKGQVVFGDALYFKQEEVFFKNLDANQRKNVKSKILKAISICIVFGYIDYAIAICKEASNRNIIDNREEKLIENNIILSNKRTLIIPDFRGKWRIAKLFYKLYKLFGQNSWAISDEELGNID